MSSHNEPIHPYYSVGFVILRCVRKPAVAAYYKHSYACIRKHYPDTPILIVDDHSLPSLIDAKFDLAMEHTTIIHSKFPPGCGEALPYYYYLQHHEFDMAIILHDSVFVNRPLNFLGNVKNFKILWSIRKKFGWQPRDQKRIISSLDKSNGLLHFHDHQYQHWDAAFGGMCVVTHRYLHTIHKEHDLDKLVRSVSTRYQRMSFERVIGCILCFHCQDKAKHKNDHVCLGVIGNYCKWNIKYNSIQMKQYAASELPLIKVWSGR